MSPFTKFAFACLLLVMSAQVSSFAQSALDNPFAIFHGAKPKGKVDSVLIYQYPYEGPATYLYVYNRKSQLIKFNLYRYWINPDFSTKNRDTIKRLYSYNRAGKLVSSGPGKTAYQYLPTKSGYTIRTNSYDSTKVFEMRFNKSGQMVQSGMYRRNDLAHQESRSIDYQYDNKRCLIGQINYYSGLSPPFIVTYKYNNNGEEVEMKHVDGEFQRISTYKYSSYDKRHNWTQQAVDFAKVMNEDTVHDQYTIRRRITYYK